MNDDIKIELDGIIKKYYEKIRLIDAVYSIYFSMKYGDKRWNDLYGTSPAYFTVVRKSLSYYFIIGLCNFFEPHKRSDLNISRFLKEVIDTFHKYNSSIPEEICVFKDYINSSQELINRLMTHRDKYIAHFDKEYFLDDSGLVDKAPLFPAEIEDLIKKTLHFFGSLNFTISNVISYAEYENKNDYIKLFALYEKAKQKLD